MEFSPYSTVFQSPEGKFAFILIYVRILYAAGKYAWYHYLEIVQLVGLIPLLVLFALGLGYLFQQFWHAGWKRWWDRSFSARVDRQLEAVLACLQFVKKRRNDLRKFPIELEDRYYHGVDHALDFIKDQVESDLYKAREMERVLDLSIAYCRKLRDELENLNNNYVLLLQSRRLRREMNAIEDQQEYLRACLKL